MVSQKGTVKLAHNGYMYTKHSSRSTGEIRWRCIERRLQCNGVVHTNIDKTSVLLMSDHNHPADDAAISVTKCRNRTKARAAQSCDKPGVIYSEAVQSLPEEARSCIPSASVAKWTLRNAKSRHNPPNPKSLSDLVISGSWATTGGAEPRPFVVYESGSCTLIIAQYNCHGHLYFLVPTY